MPTPTATLTAAVATAAVAIYIWRARCSRAINAWGGPAPVAKSAAVLHHVPGTISSPVVQALIELDVPETVVRVRTLSFPELKASLNTDINPMGTSPSFQDGTLKIWESSAVLLHLLETHDLQHRYHPPPGSAKRAQYLQLQAYIVATVYPAVASLFLHTLKPAAQQDAGFVENGKAKWSDLLGPTLAAALGAQPYLLGDELSAVDFLVAKPLRNAHTLGLLMAFPTLDALFRRISARTSYASAYQITQR